MKLLPLTTAILISTTLWGQSLPKEWNADPSTRLLTIGGEGDNGLYDESIIREFYLEFSQSNYWTLLQNNYSSGTDIAASLTVDGVTYPNVGVSFKGNTSYNMIQNSEKKSFSIKMNAFIDGQDLMGYSTLNLNNCFEDASFLREFLYLHLIRNHIPAAKANFVHLFINGEDWGLYPNVQQVNEDMMEEWFLSDTGSRWRATSDAATGGGPGGGGGPQWGDGTAALNYLDDQQSTYEEYYTLKSSAVTDPWSNLINTCDVLENTPIANLSTELPAVMDVDRALWFLACEIAFGDDDSYVYKGKMDYYLYWEIETGRMVPLEFDGNSCLIQSTSNWSPFYHADNANYPLLYRLMQVPAYRQRYLAHMRTIVDELLDLTMTQSLINDFGDFIDAQVQSDPKKLYTYNAFLTELTTLQTRLTQRRTALMNNAELNTTGAVITNPILLSEAGEWINPSENESVVVSASVTSSDGIYSVNVYYSSELVGNFSMIQGNDNGSDGDLVAGDGIYSATIPGMTLGTTVRFYFEALENNTAQTRSYLPVGAEHDVYYYQVMPITVASSVVVNELMASNSTTQSDESGEYNDWIELYNTGATAVDLSGYYLTDNEFNLTKWQIPDGTLLEADDYLIIWADEDSSQGPLHANFKLAGSGESVILLAAEGVITDQITFGSQTTDQAFARHPNGVGDFVIQGPTFDFNNDLVSVDEMFISSSMSIFPNPTTTSAVVQFETSMSENTSIQVIDMRGVVVIQTQHFFCEGINRVDVNTQSLAAGTYIVRVSADHLSTTALLVKQ